MTDLVATSRALHLALVLDSVKMDVFILQAKVFVASALVLLCRPCHADANVVFGSQCSGSDSATLNSGYQANFNNLLISLTTNGPMHNGFYTTAAGNGNNKIYGLTQCRGDLSAVDCAECIKNSTMVRGCANSKDSTIWLRWCLLRYSNVSFFGALDQSALAKANDTDFDDPNVVSRGLDFMSRLASTAPNQPFMFQTAVLDVGQYGKRYGMAQCTRDVSKSDCSKCLVDQMATFRTTVGNKRGWEIYGSSCSMWYHDFQFYFNYTIPANEGATRYSPCQVAIGIILAGLSFLAAF